MVYADEFTKKGGLNEMDEIEKMFNEIRKEFEEERLKKEEEDLYRDYDDFDLTRPLEEADIEENGW